MAKRKLSRKELLKSPDEFLTISARVARYLSSHIRELKYAGAAVAVIIAVYIGVTMYIGSVNNKGQEAYNLAYYNLAEEGKLFPDSEELKESEELFRRVIEEHGMSKAAELALPQIAHAEFVNGNYDEAEDLYGKFLKKFSWDSRYKSLTSVALAACYEARGKIKTAIEILEPVLNERDNPFRESAMLSLARLYRLDNRMEQEKAILKDFIESYRDSPFLPMAQARL